MTAPSTTSTCDTVDVSAGTAAIVAAVEVTEAMKIVLGEDEKVKRQLFGKQRRNTFRD